MNTNSHSPFAAIGRKPLGERGAAAFNLFGSLLGGLLVFGSLFLMAQWATRTNPQILRILLNSNKFGCEYDSAKYSDPNVRVIHHA